MVLLLIIIIVIIIFFIFIIIIIIIAIDAEVSVLLRQQIGFYLWSANCEIVVMLNFVYTKQRRKIKKRD